MPSEPAPTSPAAFPTGPLLVECAGTPTYTFGPFDTVCDTAADCAIVQHALDCCGSHAAHGIRGTEASRFDAEEARCGATIAGCRCEAAPTRADDGSTQRRTPPSLDCIAHRCVTFFAR